MCYIITNFRNVKIFNFAAIYRERLDLLEIGYIFEHELNVNRHGNKPTQLMFLAMRHTVNSFSYKICQHSCVSILNCFKKISRVSNRSVHKVVKKISVGEKSRWIRFFQSEYNKPDRIYCEKRISLTVLQPRKR